VTSAGQLSSADEISIRFSDGETEAVIK